MTRLFAWTTICLLPTALLFQNLSAHRYFLPAFLAFHLLVFQALAQANFSKIKKNCLLAALCLGLGTGNLWHYPTGVATGWDATLASLPYHDLRRQAIAYLSAQNIDFQTVGTAFPNINRIEDTDLNDDPRSFAPADFAQNRYILWSNIFNDFEKADLERLEREWRLVKKWERAGVSLRLFQRADEPSNLR